MLLLERLSDARRNGHRVLAVVRGSRGQPGRRVQRPDRAERPVPAAGHPAGAGRRRPDGRPTSTWSRRTAPAPRWATRSRRRRCSPPTARTRPETAAVARLGQVQHRPHPGGRRCRRASSRWCMAMRHGVLPQTLHVDEPTPHVDWSAGAVRAARPRPAPGRTDGRPRRAGVSSFGISGTNAHVILEEAPPTPPARGRAGRTATLPVRVAAGLVSARTDAGAARPGRAAGWPACATHARAGRSPTSASRWPRPAPRSTTAPSCVGRRPRRAARRRWTALAARRGPSRRGRRAWRGGGPAAFVCSPGRARSGLGMGRELYEAFPVFAGGLRRVRAGASTRTSTARCGTCCATTRSRRDWTDVDTPAGAVRGRGGAVPALAESWGVRPDVLVGHSIGELAAAHVAGVLLAGGRGAAGGRARPADAGAAGAAARWSRSRRPRTRSRPRLEPWGERLALAAVNGPTRRGGLGRARTPWRSCCAACERARQPHQAARGQPRVPLAADGPDAASDVPRRSREIAYDAPRAPGRLQRDRRAGSTPSELATPDYWVRHVREAVRFADGVRALIGAGVEHVPRARPRRRCSPRWREDRAEQADATAVAAIGSLRRADGGLERIARSLAEAHAGGVDVDWADLFAGQRRRPGRPAHLRLPARALLARARSRDGDDASRAPGSAPPAHPLLGAAAVSPAGREETVFTGRSRWAPTPGWPTTPSPVRRCCPAPPSSSWPSGPAGEVGCDGWSRS